jgi:hypothetical protein
MTFMNDAQTAPPVFVVCMFNELRLWPRMQMAHGVEGKTVKRGLLSTFFLPPVGVVQTPLSKFTQNLGSLGEQKLEIKLNLTLFTYLNHLFHGTAYMKHDRGNNTTIITFTIDGFLKSKQI